MKYLLSIVIFCCCCTFVCSSIGDSSTFYVNCRKGCLYKNCTNDGLDFINAPDYRSINAICNRILYWNCNDECAYQCMWRTTNAFIQRGWNVPQFHGKWPFQRFFGLQEPASVLFSMLNFWAHLRMIKKFRQHVRRDSPMYYIWHIFCGVCLNAWFWSCIFHARDYPITEYLDYGFAYSVVLATLICMILRMLHNYSNTTRSMITFSGIIFFFKDFLLFNIGRLNYGYNMKKNVFTGVASGVGWIIWSVFRRKSHPYSWKIFTFQILAAASLLLELNDFSPILWTFDAHSLWHLSTVPLTIIFYSFLIDDCKRLRHDKYETDDKLKLI